VKKAAAGFVFVAAVFALSACSLTRVAYDNADIAARFMAHRYLELDGTQAREMSARIADFHRWHRTAELPAYAALMRSASQRAARGITVEDVAWGLANVRVRYRRLAAAAAEEAAPVLATLRTEQIAALEHRFSEENDKYSKQYLPPDEEARRRAQLKRAVRRIEDFTGDLSREQEALVGRFVTSHEHQAMLRFDDRRRWQHEVLALLGGHLEARDLGSRLAQTFNHPELRRSEEFAREQGRWDEDFARLIADIDRTLSPSQRAHLVRRFQDYAEDFASLAGRKAEPT
jgi:hypothetical protein